MPSPTSINVAKHAGAAVLAVPPGSAAWITPELIAKTLHVWQPLSPEPLTPEDALEILQTTGRLLEALEERHDEEVFGAGAGE